MNEKKAEGMLEIISGMKLKVTLTHEEWRTVLMVLLRERMMTEKTCFAVGKIFDKIAKQTNDQVEKIYKKLEGGNE